MTTITDLLNSLLSSEGKTSFTVPTKMLDMYYSDKLEAFTTHLDTFRYPSLVTEETKDWRNHIEVTKEGDSTTFSAFMCPLLCLPNNEYEQEIKELQGLLKLVGKVMWKFPNNIVMLQYTAEGNVAFISNGNKEKLGKYQTQLLQLIESSPVLKQHVGLVTKLLENVGPHAWLNIGELDIFDRDNAPYWSTKYAKV